MTPAMQAAAAGSSAGHDLTPHAKAALVLDAEQDMRALERELREIDVLEKQGAAGAGRLAGVVPHTANRQREADGVLLLTDVESVQSRLETVISEKQVLRKSYAALESRVEQLLADYDNYVRTAPTQTLIAS